MILQVQNLHKEYFIKRFLRKPLRLKAINDLSFSVEKGKTLGVVGESGCGKSTLAKIIMQIERPTQGHILFEDRHINSYTKKVYPEKVQMIFQDPYSSLNPRKKIWKIIAEPLFIRRTHKKKECFEKALTMMEKVGLRSDYAHRYPHMFSGGQRQRIAIARALTLHPEFLILDEPVSALDVSVQAQVLNLLIELQNRFNLSYLFISHDLSVVKHIADMVLVMYLGEIMEYGPREEIFLNPKHPYTKALLASILSIKTKDIEIPIKGELPSAFNPPSGCVYRTRCPFAEERCQKEKPIKRIVENREVSCHFA